MMLGTDPSKPCLGISGYVVHHANKKGGKLPKRMTVWSQKEKVYGSEGHCEITTNHTNSKQPEVFNLIYLF